MSFEWLCGLSGAESKGDVYMTWPPGDDGKAQFIPVAVTNSITGLSGYGWRFQTLTGGDSEPGWSVNARTKDWIEYCGTIKVTAVQPPASNTVDMAILYTQAITDASAGLIPTGSIVLTVSTDSASNLKLRLYFYNGSGYTVLSSLVGTLTLDTVHYWRLRINTAEVGAINNNVFLDLDGANIAAVNRSFAIAESDFAVYGYFVAGGKGGSENIIYEAYEYLVGHYDSDGDEKSYDNPATAGTYHCLARFPNADDTTDDDWSQVGSCDASEKYRTVIDANYAGYTDGDEDHIHATGSGLTQLFEKQDSNENEGAGTTAVELVGVLACGRVILSGSKDGPDLIVLKENGTKYTSAGGNSGDFGWRMNWWKTPPGSGGTWTPALFDAAAVRIGGETNQANKRYAYTLFANIIGTNLEAPDEQADCLWEPLNMPFVQRRDRVGIVSY